MAIPLQPLYSFPCEHYKQMILIARDVSVPPNGLIGQYRFAPDSQTFHPAFCECCPIIEGADEFEYTGTRGFWYQRSHHDVDGNPLICLWVSWEDTQGHSGLFEVSESKFGSMEYFVSRDGLVSKYEYVEETHCFKAIEFKDCFMTSKFKDAPLEAPILDKNIVPICSGYCESHGKVIMARPPKTPLVPVAPDAPEPPILILQWNPHREQFEMITCTCNLAEYPREYDRNGDLKLMEIICDDGMVNVMATRDRKMRKVMERSKRKVKAVVMRDLRGKTLEELESIRKADEEYYDAKKIIINHQEHFWYLFRVPEGKSIVADKKGNVKLAELAIRKSDGQRRRALVEEDEMDEAAQKRMKKNLERLGLQEPESRLDERIQLCNALKQSVKDELGELQQQFFQNRQDKKDSDNVLEEIERSEEISVEERQLISKAILESKISFEFQEFQKKMRDGRETRPEINIREVNWDDYDNDDDETVVEEDSDDSDVDYDDSEEKKTMAPESVITRPDDGVSVLSDVTDFSVL